VTGRALAILLAVASAAALTATGAWYHANRALQDSRAQLVASTLQPIAELLKENQSIILELQGEPFAEKDAGILESYLTKIRRDGVPQNAQTKQRLDQLAENNTAIVTLINAYAPHAKTSAFTTAGDKFRNYASSWRDRWNSVMELFMAGGNYAASEVPFPKEFPQAVQAEITAAPYRTPTTDGSGSEVALPPRRAVHHQYTCSCFVQSRTTFATTNLTGSFVLGIKAAIRG
jgi:hypothetical protein